MKHDLEALSRDILGLIKTTGDTGDTGDRSDKPLRNNNFFVPTRREVVSPLNSDWGQLGAVSGDRKSERLQSFAEGVPGVPAATTTFAGAAQRDGQSRAPAEWHEILAELERTNCPSWMSKERWRCLLFDAENFLSRWGAIAHAIGWTALDLYGVHPTAPAARFDVLGLLFLIQGGEVAALTDGAATIRRWSGAVLTYRRANQADAILISDACSSTTRNVKKSPTPAEKV